MSLVYQGSAYLDSSVRRDAHGNQLIVLANPTNRGKPLPPATQVTLAATAQELGPGVQAFGFPAARHQAGRVTAGPQPLRVEREGGHPVLPLPQITSALPVLLARDFGPLLSIDAPETAADGTTMDVRVTCYNPSPKPLRATLRLVLPPTWRSVDEKSSPAADLISVPARGNRTFILRARSGGGERSVIKAQLDYVANSRGTARIESVPVDVFANVPPP